MKRLFIMVIAAGAIGAIGGCKDKESGAKAAPTKPIDAAVVKETVPPPPPPLPTLPLGLPRLPERPSEITPALVARGAELFSDERTWGGHSCAGCHQPERGFSSSEALDRTAGGKISLRHTPALINLAYARSFYWDGRAATIASLLPNHVRGQLGSELPDPQAADALAAFVLTRYSGAAPWDRHESGDTEAVSADAIRGAVVFNERAGCAVCHPPPLYTDLGRHKTVVPPGSGPPDPASRWKTPTLRAIAKTAPYFHAGTSTSLAAALEVELGRGDAVLTAQERADLLAFLRAL